MVNSGTDSFAPLVSLLQEGLQRAGLPRPDHSPETPSQFASWYLDVVQQLERQVAQDGEHPAMSRGEVELMARCALSGADVAQAIELVIRFAQMLHPRAGALTLRCRGERAQLQLRSLRVTHSLASDLSDITGLFAFYQLFSWLAGRPLPLQRVRIGPMARENTLPLLRLFQAPVLAGGDCYSLEFDCAALRWVNVRSAAELDDFIVCFPCAVLEPAAASLSARVETVLSAALRHGLVVPTQAQVAADFALPLATFRRRLAAEGKRFSELRRRCLQQQACLWLEQGVAVAEVAQRLGFSDAGSFRRAFHQWLGCAPSAWRAA
jgi:AraC-like DNA-binding protein